MNLIQDYGVNEFLARRLNITDSPAPANTLAPEVMPVILGVPPRYEDDFLRGERRAMSEGDCQGGVATYGVFRIYNPTFSRTIVIVERVLAHSYTAGSFIYAGLGVAQSYGTVDMAGAGTTLCDTRFGATATNAETVAIAEKGFTTPAFVGGPILFRLRSQVDMVIPPLDLGVVLAPGYALDFWTAATETGMQINLWFRERPAQPSELG